MNDISTRFRNALTFPEYLETVQKNEQLWKAIDRHVHIPPELVEEAAQIEGDWHLLALSEDWCGDAVNILPVVAAFANAVPNLELKVLQRDQNLDLMDAHLTNGRSRSIPIVIFYDDDFEERGWWGPRPTTIQQWVINEGLQLEKDERYKKIRQFYARDKGRSIVRELIDTLMHSGKTKIPS